MKPRDHDINRLLSEMLSDANGAPDLTRQIMGRLGYMHCVPAVVRRRRMLRIVARGSVSLMIAFVILGTYLMVQKGPSVRRPAGPTLPAAFKQEVEQQRSRLEELWDSIPRIESDVVPDQYDNLPDLHVEPGSDVDRSAMALVRWM